MKFLYIIIAVFLITGCANKSPQVTTEDPTSSISRMGSIAEVLGCMFAPDTCPTKKSTQEQHDEADKKIISEAEEKEWDDVDKETNNSD
tara:strand:- start:1344 stop:1610 length:267 start_codon:yes stop_codon:yes gene_type:complete